MQYLVGGDYNRTPVKFRVPDIYLFVGDIAGFAKDMKPQYLV
jgi:hypothetical protein